MNILKFNDSNSEKIAEFLKNILFEQPVFSITSGSGFSEIWENFEVIQRVNYSEIPGMPLVSIAGHSNILYLIKHNSTFGLIFGGRFHLYEGHTVESIMLPLLIPYLLGVRKFIFMNAAGGLNPKFEIGDLMIINSALNFTKRKPESIFTNEIVDKSIEKELFDSIWRKELMPELIQRNIQYQEGTLIAVTGPSYETTAEIRMFRRLGGDSIGMSTALESIAGSMIGAEVLAFSVITNKLSEINTSKISHKEVLESLELSKKKVEQFIRTALDIKFK